MNKQAKFYSLYGFLSALVMLLPGTAGSEPAMPADEPADRVTNVSIVSYIEQEAGTDPYPVRILVSPGYVRIDDDYDESDFVLFDRRTRMLFSVAHENRSVLVIKNHPFSGSLSPDITLTEQRIEDDDAPAIAGKQPEQVNYLANGTSCYQTVSVSGLLDEAVAGMAEYALALGDRQLNNLQSVPESMQTPCFLSRYGYATGRHYAHGLPVQVWDGGGFHRSLTDFREHETVASALFQVPDDYDTFSLGQ